MKGKVIFIFLTCLFSSRLQAQEFTRFFQDTAELQSANRFLLQSNGQIWIGGNKLPTTTDELRVWVYLLDSEGNPLKKFRFGPPGYQTFSGMGLLPDGQLVCAFGQKSATGITENFIALLDTQSVISLVKIEGADQAILDDAKITSKGKVLICGFRGQPGIQGNNFYVAQVNPFTGIQDWIFEEDISPNDHIKYTIESVNGTFLVSGDVQQSSYNPYVARLDSNGSLIWDLAITTVWNDGSQKMVEDSLGRIWLVGESSTAAGSEFDNQLNVISPDGQLLWQQFLGSEGQDAAFIIKKAKNNGFWVGGYSNAQSGNGAIGPFLMRLNRFGQSLGEAFWSLNGPSPVYDLAVVEDSAFYFCGVSNVQAYFMKRIQPTLENIFVVSAGGKIEKANSLSTFFESGPFQVFDFQGRFLEKIEDWKELRGKSNHLLLIRNAKNEIRKFLFP
jgi:hypothetical protein